MILRACLSCAFLAVLGSALVLSGLCAGLFLARVPTRQEVPQTIRQDTRQDGDVIPLRVRVRFETVQCERSDTSTPIPTHAHTPSVAPTVERGPSEWRQ